MGSANVSKVERVQSTKNSALWVDLCLDKREGDFFAQVGDVRVRAPTKGEAVRLVREALDRVTEVAWRAVILIRVDRAVVRPDEEDRDDDEEDDGDAVHSREDGRPVYGSACSFAYLRRERAAHPLRPKETVEREHAEDFERRVAQAREREVRFGQSRAYGEKRADERERELRDQRAALADIGGVWDHEHPRTVEHEVAYSPEAWAGVQRLARALRDTQRQLSAFLRAATPEGLTALAGARDALRQLGTGSAPASAAGKAPRRRRLSTTV